MRKILAITFMILIVLGCGSAGGSQPVRIEMQWAQGAQCYVAYNGETVVGFSCVKQ